MNCGLYKHYKGGVYLLLGVGEHTETGEQFAVFVSLDASLPGPRIRLRPLAEFIGYVTVPLEWNGTQQVPRYEFVGDAK